MDSKNARSRIKESMLESMDQKLVEAITFACENPAETEASVIIPELLSRAVGMASRLADPNVVNNPTIKKVLPRQLKILNWALALICDNIAKMDKPMSEAIPSLLRAIELKPYQASDDALNAAAKALAMCCKHIDRRFRTAISSRCQLQQIVSSAILFGTPE